ncbi:hypothetical protein [Gloeobacter violaceus]|nr:hypothetical protein [Gloeobacter violaceus]
MASQPRRPLDTSLQGLAGFYSRNFLSWLIGGEVTWLQQLDSVIVAQQRRADFLVRYRDDAQERLLHAEFQNRIYEEDLLAQMPFRMASYALAVRGRYGQLPVQVLILLKDSEAARRVPAAFIEGQVRVDYRLVRLWEVDPRPIVDGGWVGLLPLVPLMEGPVAQLLEQTADAIEAQVQSSQERTGLLSVTLLLAALRANPRLLTEFVSRRNMQNILTETPFFQQLLQEQVQQRVQEQVEQRVQEQVEQRVQAVRQEAGTLAQLETRRADLLRVLARKFGPVSEELAQQLQGISESQRLEQLLDLAVDATDLDTFRCAAQF